jgi:hypothetical protein
MLLIFLFLVWVFLWVASSLSFDNLIKYQYENHFEQWKESGCPRGMFYKPKNSTFWGYYALAFRSTKEITVWVNDDSTAMHLLKKVLFWKKIVVIYFIMFLPLAIIAVEMG